MDGVARRFDLVLRLRAVAYIQIRAARNEHSPMLVAVRSIGNERIAFRRPDGKTCFRATAYIVAEQPCVVRAAIGPYSGAGVTPWDAGQRGCPAVREDGILGNVIVERLQSRLSIRRVIHGDPVCFVSLHSIQLESVGLRVHNRDTRACKRRLICGGGLAKNIIHDDVALPAVEKECSRPSRTVHFRVDKQGVFGVAKIESDAIGSADGNLIKCEPACSNTTDATSDQAIAVCGLDDHVAYPDVRQTLRGTRRRSVVVDKDTIWPLYSDPFQHCLIGVKPG